jgi:hypothetical protein
MTMEFEAKQTGNSDNPYLWQAGLMNLDGTSIIGAGYGYWNSTYLDQFLF